VSALQVAISMGKGSLVLHLTRPSTLQDGHERTTLHCVAESIASFKGLEFAGCYDPARVLTGPVFLVPDETLVRTEADKLGIRCAEDVFGGVVPHEFVKTKVISHELVSDTARRPDGWSEAFGRRVRDVVLPGYSAFARDDAREAARRLLPAGRVRAKLPSSAGARGQHILESAADLESLLDGLSDADLAQQGLLLEVELEPVTTLSVGHVRLDDTTLAYHGRQWLTRDNGDQEVYGGSELSCVRGGWDTLARLDVPANVRAAIRQARVYDEATAEYGIIASRRNYDVGQGVDGGGREHSGVFEASWRVGGASPAELAAFHVLARSPEINRVRVVTVEAYGADVVPPPEASIHFHGVDDRAGPLLRYTAVQEIGA
jgi:uncharacterized protein DUF3182